MFRREELTRRCVSQDAFTSACRRNTERFLKSRSRFERVPWWAAAQAQIFAAHDDDRPSVRESSFTPDKPIH